MNSSVAKEQPKGGCAGKSKDEWYKILAFYFTFHALLIIFFTICYTSMLATIPDRRDGPKTSFILNPGVRFYPKEITSSRGGASYNTGEEIGEIDQMYIFDEGNFDRQPLSLNRASFGDCSDPETVREAYRNFDYFCVFVKLNRVHSFKPKQDVKLSAKLDFPSVGEFNARYGEFNDFVTFFPSVLPVNEYFPFLNRAAGDSDKGDQPDPFFDSVVAMKLDVSQLSQEELEGTVAKLRIGVQFDYGNEFGEERDGYGEIEIDISA